MSPIPQLAPADQRPLTDATARILKALDANPNADVSALEAKVNRIVYDLYGLTDEEIRLVEEWGGPTSLDSLGAILRWIPAVFNAPGSLA